MILFCFYLMASPKQKDCWSCPWNWIINIIIIIIMKNNSIWMRSFQTLFKIYYLMHMFPFIIFLTDSSGAARPFNLKCHEFYFTYKEFFCFSYKFNQNMKKTDCKFQFLYPPPLQKNVRCFQLQLPGTDLSKSLKSESYIWKISYYREILICPWVCKQTRLYSA